MTTFPQLGMRILPPSSRLILVLGTLLTPGIFTFRSPAHPPLIPFEHFSVETGLSHSEVKCIVEDRMGYLWIGTADGLNRFDGYDFKVFRHVPSDAGSLEDNFISALTVDRSGTLWVGTRVGGLHRLDPRGELFEKFTHNPDDSSSLGEGAIVDVYEDRSGQLWVTTNLGGLNKFDPGSGTFKRYQMDPSNPFAVKSNNLGPMYDDGDGTLWVGSWASGLHGFDMAVEKFRQYGGSTKNRSDTVVPGVISIFPAGDGRLWTGTRRQLNLFDRKSGRFTLYLPDPHRPKLISKNVTSLRVDRFGILWIGTFFDGLITIDPSEGESPSLRHYNYGKDRRAEGWIPNSHISEIYEDRRGNVWIGTDDGLLKASRNRNRFRHVRHIPGDASSPIDDRVRTVFVDAHDRIWIGTEGGLIGYDRGAGVAESHVHEPGDPGSIGGNVINSMIEDSSGSLWLALDGEGLNSFSPRDRHNVNFLRTGGRAPGAFTRIKNQGGRNTELQSNWVHALLDRGSTELWVGTIYGAYAFNPERMSFRHLQMLEYASIMEFLRAKDGTVWVGTHESGVFRISERREKADRFAHDPDDPTSIGDDRIRSLHEDAAGRLWAGTAGSGVWRFDPATGNSRSFTEADGLAGNSVEGIIGDQHGAVWISTNNGLSRFDAMSEEFRTFRQPDGLPTNRFRGNGARTANAELVFGTAADGIVMFHPDSLDENTTPPPVFVTALNMYGSEMNVLPRGGERPEVVVPYSENSFTIEYLALDCTAPEKNMYLHRLDGYNADWVSAGSRRSVTYRNLEPGEYTFHVKGSNNDAVWADASVPLRLTILPPFWRTWWFYGLSSAVLSGILISLHRYRLRKVVEMERLRVRIASDLHDDLGSNLSGIALMTDLVGGGLTPGPEREKLALISRTARQMADTLKDLVWTINPGNDTFDNLALRMKDTAATLLNGIGHEFIGAERPAALKLPIEARRNLYLVFKEILHNIVKHSRAKRVEISFMEKGDRLLLTVSDDGIGFRQEEVVSGSGLGNIRSRATGIGGEVSIDSRPGGGTRISVAVKIP